MTNTPQEALGTLADSGDQDDALFTGWTPTHRAIADHLKPLIAAHSATYYPEKNTRRVRFGWPLQKPFFLLGTVKPVKAGVILTLRVGKNCALIGAAGPFERDPGNEDVGRITLTTVSSVTTDMDKHIAQAVAFMGRSHLSPKV